MRIFLFAGLLDIALGLAFLASPRSPAEIQEIDANTAMQTNRSAPVSPVISFLLLASGIALIVTSATRRRRPEQPAYASSLITPEATTEPCALSKRADCGAKKQPAVGSPAGIA
jgi:hypothetical protein